MTAINVILIFIKVAERKGRIYENNWDHFNLYKYFFGGCFCLFFGFLDRVHDTYDIQSFLISKSAENMHT